MKLIITLVIGMAAYAAAAYQEKPCAAAIGKCMEMKGCNGKTIGRKCPTQGASIMCCVGHNANAGKPKVYQEKRCARVGGVCKATNDCSAPDAKVRGKCPTQRDVFCCVPANMEQQSVDVGNPACVLAQMHEEGEVNILNSHSSGVRDDASALQNVQDFCDGNEGARSCYDNAPCGHSHMDNRVLQALVNLAPKFQDKFGRPVQVNEFLGGSHSKKSKHYFGLAIDFQCHNDADCGFLHDECMANGAQLACSRKSTVCAKGHRTHVHCQWTPQK